MIPDIVLTIAGFDPTGGAGITLDSRLLSPASIYPVSVITGIVSQNTEGVQKIFPHPKEVVRSQLLAVFSDIVPSAVKIGMLVNKDVALIVWGEIRKHQIPVVVDPVWKATSGEYLFEGDYRSIYMDFILPVATIVTPNLSEAQELSGVAIEKESDMINAAERILDSGVKAVLIKGGLFEERRVDLYADSAGTKFLEVNSNDELEIHGTGCTLATLIIKNLIKGRKLFDSVIEARKEFFNMRRHPLRIGRGHPVLWIS